MNHVANQGHVALVRRFAVPNVAKPVYPGIFFVNREHFAPSAEELDIHVFHLGLHEQNCSGGARTMDQSYATWTP
jgi:hypothetical protein